QLWLHHTGHDEDRSYGDKTREWQMTVVMLMKARSSDHPKFKLEFRKARGRKQSNRSDFEPLVFEMQNDKWTTEQDKRGEGKGPPARNRILDLVKEDTIATITAPPDLVVPAGRKCTTEDRLREAFVKDALSRNPDLKRDSIERNYRRVLDGLKD